jgi:hypothetical protein
MGAMWSAVGVAGTSRASAAASHPRAWASLDCVTSATAAGHADRTAAIARAVRAPSRLSADLAGASVGDTAARGGDCPAAGVPKAWWPSCMAVPRPHVTPTDATPEGRTRAHGVRYGVPTRRTACSACPRARSCRGARPEALAQAQPHRIRHWPSCPSLGLPPAQLGSGLDREVEKGHGGEAPQGAWREPPRSWHIGWAHLARATRRAARRGRRGVQWCAGRDGVRGRRRVPPPAVGRPLRRVSWLTVLRHAWVWRRPRRMWGCGGRHGVPRPAGGHRRRRRLRGEVETRCAAARGHGSRAARRRRRPRGQAQPPAASREGAAGPRPARRPRWPRGRPRHARPRPRPGPHSAPGVHHFPRRGGQEDGSTTRPGHRPAASSARGTVRVRRQAPCPS